MAAGLDTAITAEELAKRYQIGEYRAAYETLRDTLAHGAKRLLRLEHAPSVQEIWALDGVSFEVQRGEVVGFIGRNGAGKSTLLKILSRITAPTRGRAVIRGRVGSVLEVGTGFHPELTGRENIFLNGSILGMSRREIVSKLPQIVEFSGIAKFMDTPVKRYSSGMYVRLAFAVAAHLDPEILIIDEVLAVGDFEFQQRCMGRIEDISGSGRTVLFVSHDMQAVTRLCDRAYWLDYGRVVKSGPSEEIVAEYLQAQAGVGAERTWAFDDAPGNEVARIVAARVVDESGATVNAVDVRRPVGVEIRFVVLRSGVALFPKLKITNARGEIAFNALDTHPRWDEPAKPGEYVSTAWIPGNLLNEGMMSVDVGIGSLGAPKLVSQVNLPGVLTFQVQDPGRGDSAKGRFTGQLRGAVRPLLEWTCVGASGSE
ncbi:MAG TPA: polysaccharide ABC transporter ATP-binding protein [Gaiellaceae bacterium]|nr:polysaccharide ABC transporter ATP-binding protein [Gaiellaceae bacterium]